jgi:hypothetical protein
MRLPHLHYPQTRPPQVRAGETWLADTTVVPEGQNVERMGDTMNETMSERGFGTGHIMDLKPTQAQIGDEIHNVLMSPSVLAGAGIPQPMTMCGLGLFDRGDPVNGRTTCDQCGNLAAWDVWAGRDRR